MPGTRAWTSAVAATALVLLVAGCTGGDPDDPPTAQNTVVVGIGEPQHLIPTNSIESNSSQVLASLFYPLVGFGADRRPAPVAAASVTPDRNNRVWTVKLKTGFTFGNGEPVTADNYIDAWNYGAYAPNGQLASYFFARIDGYVDLQSKAPDGPAGPQPAPTPKANRMSGLKKVDDTTFTVTLSAPFAGWESVLGATAFYPLPRAAFSAPGVIAAGFEETPIGNG